MRSFVSRNVVWTRLQGFMSGFGYGRYQAFYLAILGFIVGLRTRLLGEQTGLSASIQQDYLLIACFCSLLSLVLWITSEMILKACVPNEIRHFENPTRFLESQKNSLYYEDDWQSVFDQKLHEWNKVDQTNEKTRIFVGADLVLSILLYVLSLIFLLIAVAPLINPFS